MIDAALPPAEAQRLEDLLENIDDLVILATPEGRIIYVNRAWREKLGYGADEIQKINAHDVLHPMHQAQVKQNEARLLAGETLRDLERTFVAKNGQEFIVEGLINYKFQDGKPDYVRAVFRDITERKEAERMKNELIAMASHELRSPLTAIIGSLEMAVKHPDSSPKMLGKWPCATASACWVSSTTTWISSAFNPGARPSNLRASSSPHLSSTRSRPTTPLAPGPASRSNWPRPVPSARQGRPRPVGPGPGQLAL